MALQNASRVLEGVERPTMTMAPQATTSTARITARVIQSLRGRGIAGYPRLPIGKRRVRQRLRWRIGLLWRRRVWRIGRRWRLICLLRLCICAIIGERRRCGRHCGLIARGIPLAGSGIDGGRYLGCATYLVGECRVAYTYRITGIERTRNVLINALLVNESAVRAAKVSNRVALAIACLANFGMMGRGFCVIQHKLVIRSAADSQYSGSQDGAACWALQRGFHEYSPAFQIMSRRISSSLAGKSG